MAAVWTPLSEIQPLTRVSVKGRVTNVHFRKRPEITSRNWQHKRKKLAFAIVSSDRVQEGVIVQLWGKFAEAKFVEELRERDGQEFEMTNLIFRQSSICKCSVLNTTSQTVIRHAPQRHGGRRGKMARSRKVVKEAPSLHYFYEEHSGIFSVETMLQNVSFPKGVSQAHDIVEKACLACGGKMILQKDQILTCLNGCATAAFPSFGRPWHYAYKSITAVFIDEEDFGLHDGGGGKKRCRMRVLVRAKMVQKLLVGIPQNCRDGADRGYAGTKRARHAPTGLHPRAPCSLWLNEV